MSRDHFNWNLCDVKSLQTVESPIELQSQEMHKSAISQLWPEVVESEEDGELVLVESSDSTETVDKDDFVCILALFFARLSTKNLIPDSTVDVIASELQNISLHLCCVTNNVKSVLTSVNASDEAVACALSTIQNSDIVKESLDAGGALSTSLKRRSFMKQNFTFVRHLPVYLGKSNKNKNLYAHYVPIHKSLIALLQDESVLKQCQADKGDDTILHDFSDGSIHRQLTADGGKCYLSLILYQDSFEVVNPLGSYKA